MKYLRFASKYLMGTVGKGTKELIHGSSLYYSIYLYIGLNFSIIFFNCKRLSNTKNINFRKVHKKRKVFQCTLFNLPWDPES